MKISNNTNKEIAFILMRDILSIYSTILICSVIFTYLPLVSILIILSSYIVFPIFEYYTFGKKVVFKPLDENKEKE
jgi:hypothetical protein